jgi:hypothetical protein
MTEEYVTQEEAAKAQQRAREQKQRIASDPQAVLKFVAGEIEVDDWVTAYPDKALNKEYREFRESIKTEVSQAEGVDPDDAEAVREAQSKVESIQARIDEWEDKLSESAVHFHLKGVSRKTLKELRKAARKKFNVEDNPMDSDLQDEADTYYKASVIAAHLEGYDIDDIISIYDNAPGKIFNDLWSSANSLSINDDFLRGIATPDFS